MKKVLDGQVQDFFRVDMYVEFAHIWQISGGQSSQKMASFK